MTMSAILTHGEIKNANKAKVTEQQRRVYLKCFLEVDKIITEPRLVFSNKYHNNLNHIKAEMKLSGSKK